MTDDFLKAYLARRELAPPSEACVVERTLHAALLADPRRPVDPIEQETPFALSLSKPVLSDAAGGVEGGVSSLVCRKVKERASTSSARTEV